MATFSSSSSSAFEKAEKISWYCALFLALLLMLNYCKQVEGEPPIWRHLGMNSVRPCDEIYVVGEGETLHTISDKCGDPFIVEENPHIQDPDDVYPGLVIKITPFKFSN